MTQAAVTGKFPMNKSYYRSKNENFSPKLHLLGKCPEEFDGIQAQIILTTFIFGYLSQSDETTFHRVGNMKRANVVIVGNIIEIVAVRLPIKFFPIIAII
jgi:hypothetical protein